MQRLCFLACVVFLILCCVVIVTFFANIIISFAVSMICFLHPRFAVQVQSVPHSNDDEYRPRRLVPDGYGIDASRRRQRAIITSPEKFPKQLIAAPFQ